MKPTHRTVLRMREQEKTYAEICQETGLAKSTISWILNKYFPRNKNRMICAKKSRESQQSDVFRSFQAKRRAAADEFYRREHEVLKAEYLRRMRDYEDQSFIHYVSGLYEGEGAHTGTAFDFCNSDSSLILPFLRFLREVLRFPEDRFVTRLSLHSSLPKEECVSHWREVCQHPINAVYQYDVRLQKKAHKHNKGKRFYGTLTIRVYKPNGLKSALKEYTY